MNISDLQEQIPTTRQAETGETFVQRGGIVGNAISPTIYASLAPRTYGLWRDLHILWTHRDLLMAWTEREIKIRYKQSVVGGLWAILQPLSLMVVFTVVFSYLTRIPSDGIPYPIFSYAALLPWTFLATALTFGVPSLVSNMNLVTKIYFPREILPFASIAAAFVDFVIASVVFLGMMLIYRIPFSWTVLWVPLLLLVQILLTLGIVSFLSAVNVFYRDIRFVLPVATQIWMYASPVLYPVTLVPERIRALYMLNPMAGLIDSYRRVVLVGQPPAWEYFGLSTVIAILVFVFGYAYLKREEGNFADLI